MWRVIHNFFWNFDSQVCDTLWIQQYRMRSYIEHETANYTVAIEVDRAITMVLKKLAFGYPNRHVANNY